jgi:hypothetical protein
MSRRGLRERGQHDDGRCEPAQTRKATHAEPGDGSD